MRWVPLLLVGCVGGSTSPTPTDAPSPPALNTEGPELILAVSRFEITDGEVTTLPGETQVFTGEGRRFTTLVDPKSNVIHKAIPWRDGILTIGGDGARISHWTDGPEGPRFSVLYEATYGGAHDRVRDLEEGDVDGDGVTELVIATHDQGIVAVLDKEEDGFWAPTDLGRTADTFVHEIELGDLDGDGTPEIYSTPSEPNQSSGKSQPGRVERWAHGPEGYTRTVVHAFEGTHAKEILVADLGEGPRLLALQEGRTGPGNLLMDPVQIVQLTRGDTATDPWTPTPIGTLLGERQARFLVAGDVDGDGLVELIATGMSTGVWLFDRPALDQPFVATQVDGSSGGFEQAAHLGDLDKDGRPELYVASEPGGDKPRQIRRYKWGKERFERSILATLEGDGIVWGISHGEWQPPLVTPKSTGAGNPAPKPSNPPPALER